MRTDIYGQHIYSDQDLLDIYLTNTDFSCPKIILVEDSILFDQNLDLENVPNLTKYTDPGLAIEEFDAICNNNWYMPESYKNFDIAKYVLDQCENEAEMQRAGQELLLYQERDMFVLLRYLKYLVDTMRANNIVWGVGRGSSVASFVLFLIGAHKINSLYYGLEIDEFLK